MCPVLCSSSVVNTLNITPYSPTHKVHDWPRNAKLDLIAYMQLRKISNAIMQVAQQHQQPCGLLRKSHVG
jgi:diketogulonate reductase-like aldo/keto reductase